ncbi:MAG: ABC transporter permease, partial [Candidatus Eremiobacteraeota bacterium]|nr:ABC transporter permease [Candidatus Eremiobacteraeota bacterium]
MKRLLRNSLLTLWAATTLTFILIRQMPGDIVYQWALQLQAMQGIDFQQAEAQVKVMLNYQPGQTIWTQYFSYLGGLLQGNLGTSLVYQIPVWKVIALALPWTLIIAFGAVSLSFVVGTSLGLLAAWKRQTRLPDLLRLYATVSQAIPDFLVGLLLVALFGIKIPIFPMRGAYSTFVEPGLNPAFLADVAYH